MAEELHSYCVTCMHCDSTKENDKICKECDTWSNYMPAPHVLRAESKKHDDSLDALLEGLKLIRSTCKEYYDERIGCANCPLRAVGTDPEICELGYNKPSNWTLKGDKNEPDNMLFR